ncbi:hypothetical protein H696_03124 [Fonticula alba]|uniref:Single-stranded DNA-binding protein n=1 Tax=Fonticula alba TaxID=691883 RepID=A0A058ZA14_FONAL|nr:hypothetical protein H696_03124 [Fonticula alba]KCV70773.1 hypothetical protein H696_03124 [Fonticula alba]|eukprot:XP_009495289.1 hypothetical protein H696_03124 [Fonticula alba]
MLSATTTSLRGSVLRMRPAMMVTRMMSYNSMDHGSHEQNSHEQNSHEQDSHEQGSHGQGFDHSVGQAQEQGPVGGHEQITAQSLGIPHLGGSTSFNRVTLLGNIGRDPEVRTTTSGTEFLRFSVATHEFRGETEWHRIIVFNNNIVERFKRGNFLGRGSQVLLEGTLRTTQIRLSNGETYPQASIIINSSGGSLTPMRMRPRIPFNAAERGGHANQQADSIVPDAMGHLPDSTVTYYSDTHNSENSGETQGQDFQNRF